MKIAVVGECMIELYQSQNSLYQQTFGGDTFNCAYYLSKALSLALTLERGKDKKNNNAEVFYVTILGEDVFSDAIIDLCRKTNINPDLIEKNPHSLPGLYMISNDATGERNFLYWRNNSPAKKLFDNKNQLTLINRLQEFDWIYFSGITLAIMSEQGRINFFAGIDQARKKNTKVAFDSNFRPVLWQNLDFQKIITEAYSHCDVALPSLSDETQIWQTDDIDKIFAKLHGFGCPEVVFKRGEESTIISYKNTKSEYKFTPVDKVIDTTAAGDSFNGGYLARRIFDTDFNGAVALAQNISAQVITQKGALVPIHI